MGGLYRRKDSKRWWIQYYAHGKRINESSRSEKRTVAEQLLKLREGEIAKGAPPGIIYDRVHLKELTDLLLSDYRINGRKSLDRAELSTNILTDFFGDLRVTQVTTDLINRFIEHEMARGLTPASINRTLAALKRMFHLGHRCTPPKVGQIPYIPMLKESNTRKGFFEPDQFLELRKHLPNPINSIASFAYYTGWRKSEILGLKWDQVDLQTGTVRLDPGMTKNDEGRIIYLNKELLGELKFLHMNRTGPYVFNRDGAAVIRFTKSWNGACKKAGIERRLFHDLRRTAVRNMVRSGIAERVAMQMSGHKTRSVFDRYHIVSDTDLKEAAKKLNDYDLTTVGQQTAGTKEKV